MAKDSRLACTSRVLLCTLGVEGLGVKGSGAEGLGAEGLGVGGLGVDCLLF